MTKSREAIRICAIPRDESIERGNLRDAFWAPLRETELFSDRRPPQMEAKVCREFGGELRSALLNQLLRGIRAIDSELFPEDLRDLRHFLFEMGPSSRDAYGYQSAEVFTRYLEHRQEVFRDNAPLREAQARLAAAASIFFSTRVASYSSLNLDLYTGSFRQLAQVFEGNFDTFRVFLDAFVPVAFAEVFNEDFADSLQFEVSIPRSVEGAFGEAAHRLGESPPSIPVVTGPQQSSTQPSHARERAEWVWRLANGSLLVPLLIALAVMFYGMRLLSDIRNSQYEALQPILQHQLELLKEDRLRLSSPPTLGASKQPARIHTSKDQKDGK